MTDFSHELNWVVGFPNELNGLVGFSHELNWVVGFPCIATVVTRPAFLVNLKVEGVPVNTVGTMSKE